MVTLDWEHFPQKAGPDYTRAPKISDAANLRKMAANKGDFSEGGNLGSAPSTVFLAI
jgi:hypothetical protein